MLSTALTEEQGREATRYESRRKASILFCFITVVTPASTVSVLAVLVTVGVVVIVVVVVPLWKEIKSNKLNPHFSFQ